jgi:hypothetical protein
MKFNDITTTITPAQAARSALRKESIVVENLGGKRLREELARVAREIDTLASKGGKEYTRAVLHKEIYEDLANVGAHLVEADLDEDNLEQAEVVIAAKAMNHDFQGFIEDVADMLGSDMITLVDQIKERFGDAAGEQYAQTVKTALEGAIDTLTQTKDSLDSAISALTGGGDAMLAPPPVAGAEAGATPGAEAGAEAPIFPSSAGPEAEPTGREIKSDVA